MAGLITLGDRVQETTSTTGTGTLSLGGASPQCQTFANGIGSGNTCTYTVLDGNGTAWFTAYGTVGSGTLTRDTIITGSGGAGVNVSLSATTPHSVFVDVPASRMGGMVFITGTTFNGTTSTVTFSSMPQVWNHLRIMGVGRTVTAGTGVAQFRMQINGDSGSNYNYQRTYSNGTGSPGTAVSGEQGLTQTSLFVGEIPTSGDLANAPGTFECDLTWYTQTTFNKIVHTKWNSWTAAAASNMFDLQATNHWNNTAAVTSLTIFSSSGNLQNGSQIQIYGY